MNVLIGFAIKDICNKKLKDSDEEQEFDMGKNLRLKSARAALDMSQQELAQRVGVSRQTINAIEKGDYNPSINLCISICKECGKTLDDLFWQE